MHGAEKLESGILGGRPFLAGFREGAYIAPSRFIPRNNGDCVLDFTLKGPLILDIGGEGRNPQAWNLNPRSNRTLGGGGRPIPRLICGRGESIPLPDRCVDVLIVERTPLCPATLAEMLRVAKPSATAILRHAITPAGDPHRLALQILKGSVTRRMTTIGRQRVQETVVLL